MSDWLFCVSMLSKSEFLLKQKTFELSRLSFGLSSSVSALIKVGNAVTNSVLSNSGSQRAGASKLSGWGLPSSQVNVKFVVFYLGWSCRLQIRSLGHLNHRFSRTNHWLQWTIHFFWWSCRLWSSDSCACRLRAPRDRAGIRLRLSY